MTTDDEFTRKLRSLLHRTADRVGPDARGWRRVERRIARRSAVTRAAYLGTAAAAASIVAIGALMLADSDRTVQLAPGVASQPTTAAALPPMTSGPPPLEGPPAGGIVFSDGGSIHVADLDGTVRFTPAQGEGTSTITHLDVRPGGMVDDFTMAYRFDAADDEVCGDISWTRVAGPGNNVAGGGLYPLVDTAATGECLGAPVFASDGSGLAWLAETPDGGVQVQAVDWTDQGLAQCCLARLDPAWPPDVTDAELIGWEMTPAAERSAGLLRLRALTAAGPRVLGIPIDRTPDGTLALGPADEHLVQVEPDEVVDRDGAWALNVLGSGQELAFTVEWPDGGLAGGSAAWGGTTWSIDQRYFLDALGMTAVMGLGGDLHVVSVEAAGGELRESLLLRATAAALLATPSVEPTPDVPSSSVPAATLPPATPAPAGTTPAAEPAPTATPTRQPTAAPSPTTSSPAPPPVRDTAAAIRDAALAHDWQRLGELIPADGFTSNFGGDEDHIGYYQREEADGVDVLGILAGLLAEGPVSDDGSLWVWPREYLTDDEYLGFRVGIDADGTWRFYVAGD